MFRDRYAFLGLLFLAVLLSGCGSTKSRSATEQLLLSDAVDRSVASIDFRRLAGCRIYLDTQYAKSVKGAGFVNADYIISSLRQQMLSAKCKLEEDRDDAEYIAEVRIGALGTDAHNVTYGIPPSNSISNAASLVPNAPPIPMIPEISLAKKEDEVAAAKIAVFVYERETGRAHWQSGIAQARSSAKDLWVFGAGPFQKGRIHGGTQFAGEDLELPKLDLPMLSSDEVDDVEARYEQYTEAYTFHTKAGEQVGRLQGVPEVSEEANGTAQSGNAQSGKVQQASHQEDALTKEVRQKESQATAEADQAAANQSAAEQP